MEEKQVKIVYDTFLDKLHDEEMRGLHLYFKVEFSFPSFTTKYCHTRTQLKYLTCLLHVNRFT